MERQSYTCEPRCQPTAVLGDDSKYFSDVAGKYRRIVTRTRQISALDFLDRLVIGADFGMAPQNRVYGFEHFVHPLF